MTTSAEASRPIVTTGACSARRRCSACAPHPTGRAEHALPHLPGAADEALAAADARLGEDQVDVVAGVLGQQLSANRST